jgi:hypothetical protein
MNHLMNSYKGYQGFACLAEHRALEEPDQGLGLETRIPSKREVSQLSFALEKVRLTLMKKERQKIMNTSF